MNYVDSILLPDERVIHTAKVHWFVFAPAAIWLSLWVWSSNLPTPGDRASGIEGIFFLIGFYYFAKAATLRRTTELTVTSKRVIAKFGFIRRNTIELNLNKVESFNIQQGIFGRMLDFGTIAVNGTGGVRTPVPHIADPIEFRRQAGAAIDAAQSKVDVASKAA